MFTQDVSQKYFHSILRVNDDTLEVKVTPDSSPIVRKFYSLQNDRFKFYLNETRYRVDSLSTLEYKNHITTTEIKKARKLDLDLSDLPETKKSPQITTQPQQVNHYQHDMIKTCINNDIPVYLVGEAGAGKNYTLELIAKELHLDFYFTNSVQQEYKLTGFIDAGGTYHSTEFYQAFTYGGLFFLDEIDASIPEVLVLLNAAIANRYFEFPTGRVTAHPEFRVVSAGNTVGSGANEMYTGRLVLDQATLDRFVIIQFDYDRNIELQLSKGNEHLVNFIRALRRVSKEQGIRATFSYRAIITTTKLEAAGIPLDQILKIAIFKGLDQDTINTFHTDLTKDGSAGKYFYALKNIQGAA